VPGRQGPVPGLGPASGQKVGGRHRGRRPAHAVASNAPDGRVVALAFLLHGTQRPVRVSPA